MPNAMNKRPRAKCSKVDTESLVEVLVAWGNLTGQSDVKTQLEPVKTWMSTKAMPPIAVMLQFASLAELMAKTCDTLRLSFSLLYDAFVACHSKAAFLGVDVFRSARNCSNYVIKVLSWYRDVAFKPEKRELVFRKALPDEVDRVTKVTALLVDPLLTQTTVNAGTAIVRCASTSSFGTASVGSLSGDQIDTAALTELEELYSQMNQLAPAGSPKISSQSPVNLLRRSNCISEDSLVEFAAQPVAPLVRRSSLTPPSTRHAKLFTTVMAEMVALQDKEATAGTQAKVGNTPKEDLLKPLPATSGAIQRAITKVVKANGGKQAFSADTPKTPAKTDNPAKGVSKVKRGEKDISLAYAKKKRKCLASKAAMKLAEERGDTKDEQYKAARAAYASTD